LPHQVEAGEALAPAAEEQVRCFHTAVVCRARPLFQPD
jgi:hypothetical protein